MQNQVLSYEQAIHMALIKTVFPEKKKKKEKKNRKKIGRGQA